MFVVLLSCGRSSTALNAPSGPESLGADDLGEAEMPPPLELTVRLRGSTGTGLLVAKGSEAPVYVAPQGEAPLTLEPGTEVTLSGEPHARLGQGGARVVSWGTPRCDAAKPTCKFTPSEAGTLTVVIEEILYVARSGQTDNLFALTFDGSSSRQLTQFTAPGLTIEQARISPDGSALVYVSNRALSGADAVGLARNLWISGPQGAEAVPLTRSVNADSVDPSWSADSQRVVFASRMPIGGASNVNPVSNVWSVAIASREAKPLTSLTQAAAAKPALSNDAKALAFIAARDQSGADAPGPALLWLANADGSAARYLSDIPASLSERPCFDPSGQRVAFAACDNLSCSARSGATVRTDGSSGERFSPLLGDNALAARGADLFALKTHALVRGSWPDTTPFSPTSTDDLGADFAVALSVGGAGALVLSETATEHRVRAFGWPLDKTFPRGTVRELVLTP